MLNSHPHNRATEAQLLVPLIDHEPPDVVAICRRSYGHHEKADERFVGVDGSHPGVFGVVGFEHGHWVLCEVAFL